MDKKYSDLCFIFDIDGTLVNIQKTWEKHYIFLYKEQCGFTLTEEELKSHFGPPELESHTTTLKKRGLYTPENAQQLVDMTEKSMVSLLSRTDLRSVVLSGVVAGLEYLKSKRAAVGCATGNIPSIAESLLRAASLRDYFSTVAGSLPQTPGRYEIVERAVASLEQQQGRHFNPKKIFVIGDTPSDIKAARKLGYISVAVATGDYSLSELCGHQPDILLPDLTGFQQALGNLTLF